MQPPTEPTPAGPHTDEAELYRRHHQVLHHAVARAVSAPQELIEDACQTAWAILLRVQPDRHTVFAWLRVVAIHEAYRLSAIERREARLRRLGSRHADPRAVAVDPRPLDDVVEALEALRVLASLPQRQRDDLALRLAGYTHEEIRARTPGRTRTNVNKSLRKARARVRQSRS